MKNIMIIFIAVSVTAMSCNSKIIPSSTPIINAEILNEEKQTILVGHCSPAILQTSIFKEWYLKNFSSYTIDSFSAKQIQPLLKHKTIEIFLGSWCGDSKREVPRLLKILEYAKFDTSNLQLIFVDNSSMAYKQSPQHEETGKFIHHVPTIIIYEGNNEIGRIVESPVVSLEKDLFSIVAKELYTPKYKAAAFWQQSVKNKDTKMSDNQLVSIASRIKPICMRMSEFNALGYVLLAQKKYIQALNVFRLNIFIYPDDAGAYDSLGEAYMVSGDKAKAKYYYGKVLELKPGDAHAIMMLEKLTK